MVGLARTQNQYDTHPYIPAQNSSVVSNSQFENTHAQRYRRVSMPAAPGWSLRAIRENASDPIQFHGKSKIRKISLASEYNSQFGRDLSTKPSWASDGYFSRKTSTASEVGKETASDGSENLFNGTLHGITSELREQSWKGYDNLHSSRDLGFSEEEEPMQIDNVIGRSDDHPVHHPLLFDTLTTSVRHARD